MIKARHLSVFVFAAAALLASPLRAEEGDLPQLNPAHFPEQLFWLAVSFGLLYFMMSVFALPAVKKTQDRRADTIKSELATAEKANETVKALMAEYEKALSDARAEAQAIIGEVSTQAAKEAAARQAEQDQKIAQRLAEAEAKITAARDAAVNEAKASASNL